MLATQNILKTNQSVQMFSTTLTVIHKESSFNLPKYQVSSVAEAYLPDPPSPTGVNIPLSGKNLIKTKLCSSTQVVLSVEGLHRGTCRLLLLMCFHQLVQKGKYSSYCNVRECQPVQAKGTCY